MSARRLRWLLRVWPPFVFAGIRVIEISPDLRRVKVRLRRHWFNRNYVGTHFGGSLFSMTDPFWMIMVMHQLGREYLVWDRAAEIEYLSAVREDVFAQFVIDPSAIDDLRARAAGGGKLLQWFDTDVRTGAGELVARVRKQLYVRLKKP